jgi:glycosyltransferase involved in cell wall biosynthesis
MKILFFSYAYPNPINPGLGTFNRTMISGLANEHEVRVVSPVPFTEVLSAWVKGRLPRALNDPSFQAVPDVKAEYCPWYYSPKFCRNQYGRFLQWSVGSALKRTMREFQPDIVVSYWTHPDGEVAVATAHQFGVPAVTIVGGSDILINARSGTRRRAILNVLQNADGVVTVSENIKRVIVADGIAEQKLHVARRGVDRRMFHEGDSVTARRRLGLPLDRPILISVGRLVDVKGHTHLIEACKLLAKHDVDFRCYLLGDGPLRLTLQRQIEQHGMQHQIELRGAQTSLQLAEWYRAADLSVLASLSEGVPNVLLESIACGTPFVASKVGGIPEIADPQFDRLVPPANPAELAEAISERLSIVQCLEGKRRFFEPPSMSAAANNLSMILQSIHSGQPTQTQTEVALNNKSTDPVQPEVGMATNYQEPISLFVVKDEAMSETKTNVLHTNDDVLGRTGEFFQLQNSEQLPWLTTITQTEAVVQRVVQNLKRSELKKTAPAFVVRYFPPSNEDSNQDDRYGRTGEGFAYNPDDDSSITP